MKIIIFKDLGFLVSAAIFLLAFDIFVIFFKGFIRQCFNIKWHILFFNILLFS